MQSNNTNRAQGGDRRAGGGVMSRAARSRDARVLIVDDHPAVRSGLEGLIAAEPGLDPIAAVGDADGAIAAYENLRPEVAVIDYHLGRRDGLSLCLALKQFRRPPQVLIFSAFVDDYLTIASIIAGADGILGKAALGHELCAALSTLVRGGRVRAPLKRDAIEAIGMSLEPQDIPVLGMLANEVASDDIAAALNTSEQWVAARRSAMLKRLVRRRAGDAPDHTAIAPV
jgi:DNA-binding NarL/FixJ family response regulator